MIFRVDFSDGSEKFLKKNNFSKEEVFESIKNCIKKFRGETVNTDVKKLHGKWQGFYRIRKGKLRIIAFFDFDNSTVFIETVDWRGGAYK